MHAIPTKYVLLCVQGCQVRARGVAVKLFMLLLLLHLFQVNITIRRNSRHNIGLTYMHVDCRGTEGLLPNILLY